MFKSKAKAPDSNEKPSNFAIAVSVSRRAKRKKMAQGGEVKTSDTPKAPEIHEAASQEQKRISSGIEDRMKAKQAEGKPGYAKGGLVDSIADAVIDRMHSKMAQGGMVDLDANSEEEGRSPYDEYNEEAGNEEQYDLDQLDEQPEDSNEHGDSEEDSAEDKHDRIEAIRKRLRK